jgi:Domain of unknown function (DUF6894)
MPICRFAVGCDGDENDDVRWTRLPDEEAAQHFARPLMRELLTSGCRKDWTHCSLNIKDAKGDILLTISFEKLPATQSNGFPTSS